MAGFRAEEIIFARLAKFFVPECQPVYVAHRGKISPPYAS